MTARVRTGYSFRNAIGSIDAVLDRLQEIGMTYAPITDTASTFGFVRWEKACKKRELKPVFGVELAVCSSELKAKKPAVDYWTFIASDSLQPIHELVALATGPKNFHYQPQLTIEQAIGATKQGVTVIVGHRSPLERITAAEGLYLGLGPAVTKGYLARALERDLTPIAVADNRFPVPGGDGLYETICGRNASTQSYPQWIMSDAEWEEHLTDVHSPIGLLPDIALGARAAVFEKATARLKKAKLLTPEKKKTLRDMCIDGAKKLKVNLENSVYAERLEKELKLIDEKQFEDYFYIIADICEFARENMLVGPARGSSCGSLVCYLLGITTIDPIEYGLIFERFIDVNRADLPDIDIDFSHQSRQKVFDYIGKKYGQERVARIGTVAMYQPRSALKEACGALDIPQYKLEPVLDSILKRFSGDSRAMQATEDTLRDTEAGKKFLEEYPEISVAMQMEGQPHHLSQHAAGIVICEEPVTTFVAMDSRTGAAMCDKKDAEDLNLLKIDALGLIQLSIFEDALQLAGLDRDHLFGVPLDDPAAFEVINRKHYSGIFQFNGLALQSICDRVRVTELNDIIAITALSRPGPTNAGGTKRWIEVRNGRSKPDYKHSIFEPYLQETLGIVTYQEQVMNIAREIGGLSWGDVNALRRAMSKSLGSEFFDQYGTPFKEGAIAKGVSPQIADNMWTDLCSYGSMGFNKSHAVAYGIMSYWCCWLKAHYPVEFAAATMTHTDNPETQIKLLRELAQEGVGYVAVDKDKSTDKWTVGNVDGQKVLVGPLTNVEGLGPKIMADVFAARAQGSPLSGRALKLLENPKTKIDSIFPVRDRLKIILPDPKEKLIFSEPRLVKDVHPNGSEYEVMIFAVAAAIKLKDANEDVEIAKRNGQRITDEKTKFLNLRLADDTDVIFARVARFDFERLGKPIIERGRQGKAIYAVKGRVPRNFRMMYVTQIRYLGDMEKDDDTDGRSPGNT